MKFITERLAAVLLGLLIIIVGLISPTHCFKYLDNAMKED